MWETQIRKGQQCEMSDRWKSARKYGCTGGHLDIEHIDVNELIRDSHPRDSLQKSHENGVEKIDA